MKPIKEFIYYDEPTAKKEIEGYKLFTEAVKQLKKSYDELHLNEPFSRSLFIKLFDNGVNILTDSYREALQMWFEKLETPKAFYGAININPDFSNLQSSLAKVKALKARYDLNPYDVYFNDTEPAYSEKVEDLIKEKHKLYVESVEEKNLITLIQDVCISVNKLHEFTRQQSGPNFSFDIDKRYLDWQEDGENQKVMPNYYILQLWRLAKSLKKPGI